MPSWWLLGLDPVEGKAGSADGDVGEERDDHLVGVRDQRRWDQPSNQARQRQASLQNLVRLPPTVQHQNSSQPSKSNLPQVFSISTSPSFPIPCIFGSIIWATTIEGMISMQEQPQQSRTSIQVSLQCPSQPTLASPSFPQAPQWSTGPPCRLGEGALKSTSS